MSQLHSSRKSPARRRIVGALVVGVATTLVLSACGGGSSGGGGNSGGSGGGTLRLAANLAPDYTKYDPIDTGQPNAFQVMSTVYGALLHENADGTYVPDLAKSVTIKDPSTIDVELPADAKFSDDSVFDAATVKWSIERTRDADNQNAIRVALKNISDIVVNSPTSLTIKLDSPIAGYFQNLLAQQETAIVSKKAVDAGVDLNSTPTGAGAFKVDSVSVEQKIVLVKNPNYVHAADVKVDKVEYLHVPLGEPQTAANLLLSKGLDAVAGDTKLTADNIEALTSGGIKTSTNPSTARWAQMSLCKSKAPFDNEKIRQALNFAVDRKALIDTGAQGQGVPMTDWWPEGNPLHDKASESIYAYDPAKAKALLAEAGESDLNFTLAVSPDMRRQAEVLQAQLKKVGVTVKLVQPANLIQEFFIDNKQPAGLFISGRRNLDKITRTLMPGTVGNVCGWDDAALNSAVADAQSVEESSPEYAAAWKKITTETIPKAVAVFLYFGVDNAAWNADTVDKVVFAPDSLGQPNVDPVRTTLK